ncbi:MAG: hypothetical protein AB9866_07955 [Syntrophobacteraceae bacterium]
MRELKNIVESAIIRSDKKRIVFEDLPENLREGVRGKVARPQLSPKLREAVRSALLSGGAGPAKIRTKSIRIVKLEDIVIFLAENGSLEFSRKDFAAFLRRCGRHDLNRSVDGTAGRYLRSLIRSRVVEHNHCRANKSRFRLSEDYLSKN